jgi:hypothetical protein
MNPSKVLKFKEFRLNENILDTPEKYIENALHKLKIKFEKMFAYDEVDQGKIKKFGDKNKESGEKVSLKDFNLELQSLELSKYSKIYDNLKLKFSDDQFLYDMTLTMNLKDAVKPAAEGTEEQKDFSPDDIETCQVRFKKYDVDTFNLMGEIVKTVKVKDVDEDLLVELKLKIDEEFGSEEEEFEIETEEEEGEKPE